MAKTEKPGEKYYFISFSYRHKKQIGFSYGNGLINIHPLEWQTQQYKYQDGEYSLLFWKEISQSDYVKYCKQIGN